MNKQDRDRVLDELRTRGEYVVPLEDAMDVEAWRKGVRQVAHQAGLRVRTMVNSRRTHVFAFHVDHKSTDIEQRAIARVVAVMGTDTPLMFDDAVEQERRAAIHVVREDGGQS